MTQLSGAAMFLAALFWISTQPHTGHTAATGQLATQHFVVGVATALVGLLIFVGGAIESECKRRHKGGDA